MVKIFDLAPVSLETITAFDVVTGSYLFTMDELQNASLAQGQEKIDITGKQGRKLTSLKRNKTLTVSGSNGMMSAGMLELQTGCKFDVKAAEVMWYDYLTVTGNKATTNFKAVGTAGNEIAEILVKDKDGIVIEVLTQDAAASEGKFKYNPATKEIEFNAGDLEDGTEIVANYNRKIQASVLDNMSDTYSGKATLYIDLLAEDKCANVYRVQIKIPKADFNGEFNMEFGDNQTIHNFEAEGLAGACGAGDILWSWTVFGAEAEDAA
jgi:hypothetical protein